MATKRETIVGLVKSRIQTILTTGGYSSNLGQHVEMWRADPWPEHTTLAVNIKDPACNRGEGIIGKFRWLLDIELQIIAAAGASTDENMRLYIGDILKAIGTDHKWGGNAQGTGQPSDDMDVARDGQTIGGATVRFTITFDTAMWSQ